MRRNVPLVSLVLILIMGFPRPAKANLWDWVQEYSGPGPFHGHYYNSMSALCPGKITGADNSEKRVLNTPYRPDRDNTCIYFDYRNFNNEDDDNFPASVSTKFYEVGVSARVHRAVEIGFGLGAVHLASESAACGEGNEDGSDRSSSRDKAHPIFWVLDAVALERLTPRVKALPWPI